jgi:hypothetical protein
LAKQAKQAKQGIGQTGQIYKAIFAQIMNNFYTLLLSSSLFLRVLRAFAVR